MDEIDIDTPENISENDHKNTSNKTPTKARKTSAQKAKKAHGRQCPVKLCSTYNARKGFYHIPEHPGRRLDWLHACKLPSTTPYSTTICWKHFELQDFKNEITEENIRQCKFGQLKKNVVPSLNLPMDDQEFHVPDLPTTPSEASNDNPSTTTTLPTNDLSELSENSLPSEVKIIISSSNNISNSPTPPPTPVKNGVKNKSTSYQKDNNPICEDPKNMSHEELVELVKKMRKDVQLLKNQNSSLRSAEKLPMTVKKRATAEILASTGKYSNAQISQMIKKKKKIGSKGRGKGSYKGPRCKTWEYDDWKRGLTFKQTANNKAFNVARTELHLPMPATSTTNKKFRDEVFAFISFNLGFPFSKPI